jgi:hypothetical protein
MRTRRQFIASAGGIAAGMTLGGPALPIDEVPRRPAFSHRGYYITFMRMPTYRLVQWKRAIDCFAEDGANLLILWTAGGFRSKKFPITWRYNAEHENVRADFARDLIDYAHARGIRVLLGFTPFGYDGVNQYPLEHPELRATGRDGKPAEKFGICCWGYNLCPSEPQSRQFMLDYVREMLFDFYPNADGLLVESSDYGVCHCDECRGRFYDHEFDFVRTISTEVWDRKPGATVIVYPHYFSGAQVPGLGVKAAAREFDPRWALFFTPHSAPPDAKLIQRASASFWSDDGPALRGPEAVRRNAQRAKEIGATGYVPSLEAFSYVPTHPEEGEPYLVGRRRSPMGMTWVVPEKMPYRELPARVSRVAYREFSRDPALPLDEFKRRLGADLFGAEADARAVDDVLELQQLLAAGRSWSQAAPVADPQRVRALKQRGALKPADAESIRRSLDRLRRIAARHGDARDGARRELARVSRWLAAQWEGDNAGLLK